MGTLVSIFVVALVVLVASWIINLIPVPAGMPWLKQALFAVLGIIFLVWLLSMFGLIGGHRVVW